MPDERSPELHRRVAALTRGHADLVSHVCSVLVAEVMKRINVDPSIPEELKVLAKLRVCQDSAAGMFGFAMHLVTLTSKDKQAQHRIATGFCEGFNNQLLDLTKERVPHLLVRLGVTLKDGGDAP